MSGMYWISGFIADAVAGDQNYANITFDGNDGVYESVVQFHFTGIGGGYVVAVAKNMDAGNLGIADGANFISRGEGVYAIPEPSSLALLALGATGLVARRRRRRAA